MEAGEGGVFDISAPAKSARSGQIKASVAAPAPPARPEPRGASAGGGSSKGGAVSAPPAGMRAGGEGAKDIFSAVDVGEAEPAAAGRRAGGRNGEQEEEEEDLHAI